MIWQADDEDDTDDHDDQFFAVNELPSEGISQEPEADLTDKVTDVGGCIDGATQQEGVGRILLAPKTAPVPDDSVSKGSVSSAAQLTRKSRWG